MSKRKNKKKRTVINTATVETKEQDKKGRQYAASGDECEFACYSVLTTVALTVLNLSRMHGEYEQLCTYCENLRNLEGFKGSGIETIVRHARQMADVLSSVAREEESKSEKGPMAVPLRAALYGVVSSLGVSAIENRSGHIRGTIYPAIHGEVALSSTRCALARATLHEIECAIDRLDPENPKSEECASGDSLVSVVWEIPAQVAPKQVPAVRNLLQSLTECLNSFGAEA